jgi:hypothetical protein
MRGRDPDHACMIQILIVSKRPAARHGYLGEGASAILRSRAGRLPAYFFSPLATRRLVAFLRKRMAKQVS